MTQQSHSPAPSTLRTYTAALRSLVETAERAARTQSREAADTARLKMISAAKVIAENPDAIRPDVTWTRALREDAGEVRRTALAILRRNGFERFVMTEPVGKAVEAQPDPGFPDRPAGIKAKPVTEAVQVFEATPDGELVDEIEGTRLAPPETRRVASWRFQAPEELRSGDPARAAEWRAQCAPTAEELGQFRAVLAAFEKALEARAEPPKRITSSIEDRNAFLYLEIVVGGRPEKAVRAEAASVKTWPRLSSRQATHKAIKTHERANGLSPTVRSAGRRRKVK